MWLNEFSSASSGQSGQGHFGQNDFVFVKWAHYNINIYIYIIVEVFLTWRTTLTKWPNDQMTIVTIFYFFSIFIEKSCLIIRRTHCPCRIFVVLFEEQFLRSVQAQMCLRTAQKIEDWRLKINFVDSRAAPRQSLSKLNSALGLHENWELGCAALTLSRPPPRGEGFPNASLSLWERSGEGTPSGWLNFQSSILNSQSRK